METKSAVGASNPEHLSRTIREMAAEWVGLPVEKIEPSASFVELGLQSADAVFLCGEIEERFGIQVDPILAFEQDSVAAFIASIMEIIDRKHRAAGPSRIADGDPEDIGRGTAR